MVNIKNLTATKIAASALAGAMIVGVLFTLAAPRAQAALAEAQIQSILSLLSSFGADSTTIANVNASLRGMPTSGGTTTGGSTSSVCPFTWTTNLKVGSTGSDVMKLQKFLNSMSGTMVASSGAGSPGNESSYYGPATGAAVKKFQEMHAADILTPVGLTSGTTNFFASTRAKANMLCSTGTPTTGTPAPSGTGLSVGGAVQPANGFIVSNAARVPFTKFTVTAGNDGDVVVNNVVVQRVGLIARGAFSGVELLDENGVKLGETKTLNSNDQATIGAKVTVPRGSSKTFTVAANFGSMSSYNGQNGGLNLVTVNTSAAVSGSLPVSGAMHTVNGTLTIGTATVAVSSFDPNTSRSKEVGSTGYIFSGIRVTAGSAEDVRVRSIRWNQTGSISATDLGNMTVVVDGTSYPAMVSADGDYFTANLGNGIVIPMGFSKEMYIKGDISGSNASTRTIKFDIEDETDIYLTGEKYGYGITASADSTGTASDSSSEFTTGTPFFDGSKVTVTAGAATTISRANSVTAQNIAVNVANQPLGGFDTNFRGEAVTVQTMSFGLSTTTNTLSSAPTNITLVDKNGSVVAGPVDATLSAGEWLVSFTDSVTFPVGLATYTLKGKIPSSATNGTGITASTTPAAWTGVKGEVTGDTITLSQGSFTMNTMTVKTAALSISVSTDPSAQTITAGSQKFVFAKYQFDATASGEDVRFSSIKFLTAGSISASAVTNCQVWDGTTALNTGSNVINNPTIGADNTFTLDDNVVIQKGTTKTLSLACDVAGGASGTLAWGITSAAGTVVVTGITSSVAVTDTITGSAGQTMTIGSGSFTVAKDASSPSYTVASGGSTGVTLGVLKLRATNEAMNLRQIRLQLNSASTSASNFVGNAVNLYDGTTLVGTAIFNGSNTFATSTLLGNGLLLPKDADKTLTIKADLATIGTSLSGTQGALAVIDYDGGSASIGTNGTYAVGNSSGSTISSGSSSDTAMDGVRIFRSFPTLAKASAPTNTLSVGSAALLRFTITADAKGDVGVYKITLKVATTSTNVTSINIFGYTDSGYSTPVSGVTSGGQLMASSANADGSGFVEVYVQNALSTANPLQIPAGTTRYFEVRGTVSAADVGDSVLTQVEGDAGYVSMATALMASVATAEADSNDDFIWSPNATGTATTSANDWANGFGLIGLPSSNMAPEVLSK